MGALCRFYESTVGKKVIMALTGLLLIGFVVGHMAGNLKTFMGFDAEGIAKLDHYAVYLRSIASDVLGHGVFLWITRGVLLGAVFLHILMAVQLTMRNRASRPQQYAGQRYSSATAASRTMSIGGTLLLVFIIFHILHFTTGHAHPHGFVEGHVYANVYNAFQHGSLVALYVVAMCALCLHLYHGTWSVFQTLGIEARGWNSMLRTIAKAVAFVVCVGFISVPIAMYAGMLPPPTGVSVQAHK